MTQETESEQDREWAGGGVYCESTNAVLSHCLLTRNRASRGGGAYSGTLHNCILTHNSAQMDGGGTYNSTLYGCTLGCNEAVQPGGGGSWGGILNGCCLVKNVSWDVAGGAAHATLTSCTVAYNFANEISGGGVVNCACRNTIVYSNGDNYFSYGPAPTTSFDHCCTWPDPNSGSGNISDDPLFVDAENGDFRLQSDSPCVNAGDNSFVAGATDPDGNPRMVQGRVDMGAYEWQVPVQFAPPALSVSGALALSLATGETGRVYAIQGSSNFVTWARQGQLTNAPGQPPLLVPFSPPPSARFFKATPVP